MAKSIFISCNINHHEVMEKVNDVLIQARIAKQCLFMSQELTSQEQSVITEQIAATMKQCDAVLFIIGDTQKNSPWITQEIAYAMQHNMKIMCTQIPNVQGYTPPELIDSTLINWDQDLIASAINHF